MLPQPSIKPKNLVWKEKEEKLFIAWHDQHESHYPLPYLRGKCPCALCRGVRSKDDPFKMIAPGQENLSARTLEPVGNYAIQIQWSDGHGEGIYTFELLRDLCPCKGCTDEKR